VRVFDAWRASTGKQRAQLDGKRHDLIAAALKLGYTVEELCLAVTGWSFSPHHRGENERRTVYNGLGLLLRDADHIDTFLKLAQDRGKVRRLRPEAGNGNGSAEAIDPTLFARVQQIDPEADCAVPRGAQAGFVTLSSGVALPSNAAVRAWLIWQNREARDP
jgi:hypothetical protein